MRSSLPRRPPWWRRCLLLRAWALRERLTIRLPISYLDIRPGARFRLPNVGGDWVAEEAEIEQFAVAVTLQPAWAHAGSRTADPGRGNPQPDVVAAPTTLALFDLPDPETNAYRKDLADVGLAGKVIASHYAEPLVRHLVAPAILLATPSADAVQIAALNVGDELRVLDISLGWAWGYGPGGRVGYVSAEAVAP